MSVNGKQVFVVLDLDFSELDEIGTRDHSRPLDTGRGSGLDGAPEDTEALASHVRAGSWQRSRAATANGQWLIPTTENG